MCHGSSICLFPSVNLVSAETFPMNLYNESLWEYVTDKGEVSSIGKLLAPVTKLYSGVYVTFEANKPLSRFVYRLHGCFRLLDLASSLLP